MTYSFPNGLEEILGSYAYLDLRWPLFFFAYTFVHGLFFGLSQQDAHSFHLIVISI
jgi:hypothetical protein